MHALKSPSAKLYTCLFAWYIESGCTRCLAMPHVFKHKRKVDGNTDLGRHFEWQERPLSTKCKYSEAFRELIVASTSPSDNKVLQYLVLDVKHIKKFELEDARKGEKGKEEPSYARRKLCYLRQRSRFRRYC